MNSLKEIWSQDRAAVNGWLAIPNGYTAELMAKAGWDSITIDLQHGVQDYMSMVACLQAMQAHPVIPLVRVPSNEPGIIGKVLDAGAYGVICPMVNTPQQAANFIAACRYPPAGHRSNGPVRVGLYGVAGTYQQTANENVLCIPMIETAQAVDALEDILAVPGIDALYVGPTDLRFSLGRPPIMDGEEPEMLDIYTKILKSAGSRGIPVAMHCLTAPYARRMVEMGFRLVTIGADNVFITQGARAAVSAFRG